MTIIRTLSKEGDEFLRVMCRGVYLHGECYAFAIALHRGTGWPIVVLMHEGKVPHALVAADPPYYPYFDARGPIIERNIGSPFEIEPPYTLQQVTEENLHNLHPVQDASIHLARRMAELLWPALPWKDSRVSKIQAFAEDLEALSRKHGLWIRAAFPGCPPMLAEADGAEGGYVFRPTDDGLTYSLDRYFQGLL